MGAIRNATMDDILEILVMGDAMHRESSFNSMSFDAEKVAGFLRDLIHQGQYVRLYERDGQILGGMMGAAVAPWYSQEKVASDFALFVKPQYRRGRAAFALVRDFIDWSKARGVKQIRPGVSTGEAGAAVESMYERIGLHRVGAVFMMEV